MGDSIINYNKFIVGLSVLILIFVIFSVSPRTDFPNAPKIQINPDTEIITIQTKLYFIDNGYLTYEVRSIEVPKKNISFGVLNALEAGPRNKLLKSPFDKKNIVISSEVVDEVCYVNLKKAFLTGTMWNYETKELVLGSIVNTLTELENVQLVQILIDGAAYENIGGMDLSQPIKRDSSVIAKLNYDPASLAMDFLEKIDKEEYELAYESLDTTSRNMTSYEEFVEYGKNLRLKYMDFSRNRYFTQNFSNSTVVNIVYEKIIENRAGNYEKIIEGWQVIKEAGYWKIQISK